MNVLFVGNSYTFYNEMPSMFEQLARTNGKDVSVFSITKGGRKLISYKNSEDPITIKLDEILKDHEFEFCFIQEQSVLPVIDIDCFLDGVSCVLNKVKDRSDHVVMYATWGRKAGSKTLDEHSLTTESMTALLSCAYQKASELYGALLSPVGDNFLKVTRSHPEINLHNADLSHPSYQGSCLAALTHFRTVFGEFPANVESLDLTFEELSAFREAVCE